VLYASLGVTCGSDDDVPDAIGIAITKTTNKSLRNELIRCRKTSGGGSPRTGALLLV
jgi:hypothetical protein